MKETRFDKLDNTANLFPVVANESMTSVYRISVTLKEEIQPQLLQEALDKVLPYFDVFNARIRQGIFWFYFESNPKEAPRVEKEDTYPCRYISLYNNHNFLFRVTYYHRRINLEVFHVLTDGMGGITFLRELTYQYLRLAHPELAQKLGDGLSAQTSLNKEDGYRKNYKPNIGKNYKAGKAFKIKGTPLKPGTLGVIHSYLKVTELKKVSKAYGVSINTYLVAVYMYGIYRECMKRNPSKNPARICVPVNLRPFFDSITIRNFFTVVGASFKMEREDYTFEEILEIVNKSLKEQINKENMEKLISYGVSNERKWIIRVVPLFIKKLVVKSVYYASAGANTTTLTNVGGVELSEDYRPFVERFHVVLSMTKGQDIKGSIISYGDELVLTFSSGLKETDIQKRVFRKLAEDGLSVRLETNGVYYEGM